MKIYTFGAVVSYEDISTKYEGLTESVNDKAVCRTSPVTPGHLNTIKAILVGGVF